MSSGFMNPPRWDESTKTFELWLREVKVWKAATDKVTGLSGVHGLQLALHLPEGSEIRTQVFDTIEPEQMQGDEGFKTVISLLERHYAKDESTTAFQTWRDFKSLSRSSDQTVDQYIMIYEQYKTRMKRYKMDLSERIHGLNLLCSANLDDDALRICMREVDNEKPETMFEDAKKSLKKYYGNSAISTAIMSNSQAKPYIKEEDKTEYESFVAWRNTKKSFKSKERENAKAVINKKFQGKQNPIGSSGYPLQCRVCRSIAHFEKDCPHVSGNTNQTFQCDASDVQVGDSLNYMVLDTGCPQNVTGLVWLNCFLDTLSDEEKACVQKFKSTNKFKFGGGRVLESLYKIVMPVNILGSNIILEFDVIDSDIPLLCGKNTMKEWNLVIDTRKETAELQLNGHKKNVDLCTSKSGHWCFNLQPPSSLLCAANTFFSVTDLDAEQKKKAAVQIHRQFCHPPFSFLSKVLRNLGEVDEEFMGFLKSHSEECHVCKRYKPTIPKPVVGSLLDPEKAIFNELVSADIKFRKGKMILYLIDTFSRYTRGTHIPNKLPTTITKQIIHLWTSIFGSPVTLLMDNGGEFANAEVRELGNQLGINIKHTAAYAPWANGLNERNHSTIDIMMEKMLEDCPQLSEETALQYAISVRNCLLFVRGFTPSQLALGHNPRLPLAVNGDLPALSDHTSSPVIAEYLDNLACARKAFIIAENSAKLRKALSKPVRSFCDTEYENGDQVFYKLPNDRRWNGPATVIGQDSKVVILRHGSILRRVHPCRLQHVNPHSCDNVSEAPLSTSTSEMKSDMNVNEMSEILPETLAPPADHEISPNSFEPCSLPTDNENLLERAPPLIEEAINPEPSVDEIAVDTDKLPKKGALVKYKVENDDWKPVKVLGRAGKANGRYSNWLNISDGQTEYSIDWSSVSEWENLSEQDVNKELSMDEICDTEEIVYLTSDVSESEFENAKLEELAKWKHFDVYDEVDDCGKKCLAGRWICSRKYSDSGFINKARFVVKGFQEKVDVQSDSPTGSKECLRIMFMLVLSKGWTLNSLDVKAAFLQGKSIERVVYLKPPAEANCPGKVWKLKKCIYGLNDASRMWYFTVLEKLESLDCVRSKFDFGVFLWFLDGELHGVLEMHVDDFIWAGTQIFESQVIVPLCEYFNIGSKCEKNFRHLGLKISQFDNYIEVDQIEYVAEIEPVPLSNSQKCVKTAFCSQSESKLFRRAVGKLNWVASQTRPDISFDVCSLSSVMDAPTISDVILLNKCIAKIKHDPVKIKFPKLNDFTSAQILLHSDASLANLSNGRSVGGFIIFLADSDSNCGPILWKSNTIKRVVRSTLAAETCSRVDGLDASYFISSITKELNLSNLQILAFTDNKPFYKSAYSTTMVNEHRLRVDLAAIKEMICKGELLSLSWIPNTQQLADCLTKKGANPISLLSVLENGKF